MNTYMIFNAKEKKRLALVQVHGLLLLLLDVISANQEGRNGLGGPEPCRCREKKRTGRCTACCDLERSGKSKKKGVFPTTKAILDLNRTKNQLILRPVQHSRSTCSYPRPQEQTEQGKDWGRGDSACVAYHKAQKGKHEMDPINNLDADLPNRDLVLIHTTPNPSSHNKP